MKHDTWQPKVPGNAGSSEGCVPHWWMRSRRAAKWKVLALTAMSVWQMISAGKERTTRFWDAKKTDQNGLVKTRDSCTQWGYSPMPFATGFWPSSCGEFCLCANGMWDIQENLQLGILESLPGFSPRMLLYIVQSVLQGEVETMDSWGDVCHERASHHGAAICINKPPACQWISTPLNLE